MIPHAWSNSLLKIPLVGHSRCFYIERKKTYYCKTQISTMKILTQAFIQILPKQNFLKNWRVDIL